jgi:hypothetical protein
MTPYQRGNRDGLLGMAAVARQRAEAHYAEAARCDAVLDAPANGVQANAARHLRAPALWRGRVWEEAAREAERMAEAMPEDPEVPEDAPRVVCAMERCTSTATHGPAGEAVVCWSHAGEWPEVRRG